MDMDLSTGTECLLWGGGGGGRGGAGRGGAGRGGAGLGWAVEIYQWYCRGEIVNGW